MIDFTPDFLKSALLLWDNGSELEAGRLIYENLTQETRPKWASNILKLVVARSGVRHPSVERVLQISEHQTEWHYAHDAFSSIRDAILELDHVNELTSSQRLLVRVLELSEIVAKVIYNATDPPDEFDEDSGWWVAESLRGFVEMWEDAAFSKAAWVALAFQFQSQ